MIEQSTQHEDNFGLDPKKWAPVETDTIRPYETPAPPAANNDQPENLRATLPSTLQLSPDFVRTGYGKGTPTTRLTPAQSAPGINAAIKSTGGNDTINTIATVL